jgi:hypothetical protein
MKEKISDVMQRKTGKKSVEPVKKFQLCVMHSTLGGREFATKAGEWVGNLMKSFHGNLQRKS